MHPAVLPAALAFSAAFAMAVYVVSRREKSQLHWTLLALLGAIMIWTCGSIFRFTVETDAGLRASLNLVFLGVFTTPPLWLLLAARYARSRPALERREVAVALLIPSALAYLALLTNDGHRLVMREVSFEMLERGGLAWAGPVFWASLVWGYACVIGGVAIYLDSARRVAVEDRPRALVLALAAVAPPVAGSLPFFGLLPVRFDPTPAALVASLALISAAVFRYRLLAGLPLARRDVIEHLGDGVLIAGARGAILDTNPAAERILRRTAAELRGRPLAEVLGELAGDSRAASELLERLPASPGPVRAELRPDADRRIQASAACVRDGEGVPAGQFAVLRDRTEESRDERVVRQTQRLESVATLAAGIAHEVNNPLAFIRANLSQIHRMGEFVEANVSGPEDKLGGELADLREIAEETLDGIARIERIVSDMRTLAGERDRHYGQVDVNEAVRDAIRLSNLRREPAIEVEARLSAALPPVEGAPQRLAQALLNLVVNAKHALAGVEGGRICLETALDDDAVVIRVSDNGPGIPEEIQERVFDPFFTTKDPDRGTGLGLAIAFDIVRDHGGMLEVRSRPGGGACFIARIPCMGA